MARIRKIDALFQKARDGSMNLRESRQLGEWIKIHPEWNTNPKYKQAMEERGRRLGEACAKFLNKFAEHERAYEAGYSSISEQWINFLLHKKYLTLSDLDERTPGEIYVRFMKNPILMKEYEAYLQEYTALQKSDSVPAAIKQGHDEKPGRKKQWSTIECAVLKRGVTEGKTISQLSESLPGRSEGAVKARLRTDGLTTKNKVGRPSKKMLEK